MILDMLRAAEKSNGFELMSREIEASALANKMHTEWITKQLHELTEFFPKLMKMERALKETSAKSFFEKLTKLYQISLLVGQANSASGPWIETSLNFLIRSFEPQQLAEEEALSAKEIEGLIAWKF